MHDLGPRANRVIGLIFARIANLCQEDKHDKAEKEDGRSALNSYESILFKLHESCPLQPNT